MSYTCAVHLTNSFSAMDIVFYHWFAALERLYKRSIFDWSQLKVDLSRVISCSEFIWSHVSLSSFSVSKQVYLVFIDFLCTTVHVSKVHVPFCSKQVSVDSYRFILVICSYFIWSGWVQFKTNYFKVQQHILDSLVVFHGHSCQEHFLGHSFMFNTLVKLGIII